MFLKESIIWFENIFCFLLSYIFLIFLVFYGFLRIVEDFRDYIMFNMFVFWK